MRLTILLAAFGQLAAGTLASGAEWIRGGVDGKEARWGIQGGIQFAIPPATPGPRGLIRILYPTLPPGSKADTRPSGWAGYELINFIAIEPIVKGRRGLSELERSRLDGRAGKRLWVEPAEMRGELLSPGEAGERLRVVIHVEAFDNGAHVILAIEQRADQPDEIHFTIDAEKDSADLEYCILTATMGNRIRARQLWLKDETVSSLKLYPDYTGRDFVPHTTYPLKALAVTKAGDVIAAITTDEKRPADVHPFPGTNRWYYAGDPVTQYWQKPKGTWREDLAVVVNARYMYWMSQRPVPGGIAFENFEMMERFFPRQQFTFGVTRRTPQQLGIRGGGAAASRKAEAKE